MNEGATKPDSPLFDRVAAILEQARANVARSVNSEMVIAYWLIGRKIVEDEQKGENRTEYGKRLIANLSRRAVNLNRKNRQRVSVDRRDARQPSPL